MNVDLTVASEADSAFSATDSPELLTLDFTDPAASARRIQTFHETHPVSHVFGIDDQTAIVAAWANRALGVPHNSVEAVEAAGDKYRQRSLLTRRGVPVPGFALHDIRDDPKRLARWTSYPCVLKPLNLSASRGVIRADDPGEFETAFRRLQAILVESNDSGPGGTSTQFLVEEFVAGTEVAIEGLLDKGTLRILALFDKPDPLDGPYFTETIYVTPSRHPPDVQREMSACAQAACQALRLERGPVHIEIRYNERGAWLIELAARPIGGKCGEVLRFGPSGAISLEQLLLSHALGLSDAANGLEPGAVGVMMVPVSRAGILSGVTGIEEALAVAGVTNVVVTAHRGQRLVPLPEESRYPAFIFARGRTPAEVEDAIRAAHRKIQLVIESPPSTPSEVHSAGSTSAG